MLVVVLLLCVGLLIALTIVHFRLSARVDALHREAATLTAERDEATARSDELSTQVAAAPLERDDALERVNRARRDAADVANRLSDEAASREQLERTLAETQEALAAAEAAPQETPASVLWGLAIRECEQRWRVSVAVGPDATSPFDGDADPFRTAVEVEVEAAREESGAALDLVWKGESVPTDERAVVALALVRDVIGALGTAAANTTITVDGLDDGVEVQVDAVAADGSAVDVWIPPSLASGPGRARIS